MNLEQYNQLCRACDDILNESDATNELISIPCLHIIREHPTILKRYSNIFNDGYNYENMFIFYKKILVNIVAWFVHFTSQRVKQEMYYMNIGALPEKIDILFVSHLINHSLVQEKEDFYYGDLPEKLAKKGLKVAIVLINQTNKSSKDLAKRLPHDSVARIILEKNLDFKTEFFQFYRLLNESRMLFQKSLLGDDLVKKRLYRLSSIEVLNSGTRLSLRVNFQIQAIISSSDIRSIMVLYEGHSWERLVFSAAKSLSKKILCIGYVHGFLFRFQYALYQSFNDIYNPDYLLTTSKKMKSLVEKNIKYIKSKVGILGSNRKIDVSNFDPKKEVAKIELFDDNEKYCLVAPEGLYDECVDLLKFSLNCAYASPNITFIWRFHPLVDYKIIENRNNDFKHLPLNIIISNISLVEDLKRSDYVLYRGSTVVLQAVSYGLFPLYLRKPGEMTIDPLYEISDLDHSVETVEEFSRMIMNMSNSQIDYKHLLRGHALSIHEQLDESIIEKILGS